RRGRRRRRLTPQEEAEQRRLAAERAEQAATDWVQPADETAWVQDPGSEPTASESAPDGGGPSDQASPPEPPAGPLPRSDVSAWTARPLPSETSSLDQWLQGPVEAHVEREAEDAWSTAGAVSGTWRPHGEHRRSRVPERPERAAAAATTTAPEGAGDTAGTEDTAGAAAADPARPGRPSFRGELH